MADKLSIYALYLLLQDLCENEQRFGGKLVAFGGDFCQLLPVVRGGGINEQVDAIIVSSPLWKHFKKLKLSENMRARYDLDFVDFLMRIGNGEELKNERHEIKFHNQCWCSTQHSKSR
ncbi:hypothetical protein LIER_31218 [Lithospermum erythrorhizon]|uniref:ATP-dependent DNA helicase n=1 Tax=Lithospermum erythrorhizon TaxID=34254 RepID=A0AAV3RW64_LITER